MSNNLTTSFSLDISQFNKSISQVIERIKLINSEFHRDTDGIDNWRKSTAGLEAQQKKLSAVIEQNNNKISAYNSIIEKAKEYQENASKKTELLNVELRRLAVQGEEDTKEFKKLSAELSNSQKAEEYFANKIQKTTVSLNNQIGELKKNEMNLAKTTSNLESLRKSEESSQTSFSKLNSEIKDQSAKLQDLKIKYKSSVIESGEMSDESKRLAQEIQNLSGELSKSKDEVKRLDESADNLDSTLDGTKEAIKKTADGFTAFKGVVANLATDAIEALGDKLKTLAENAIEYESSFMDVRKTVDGSEKDFARLDKQIKSMSDKMPQSASDIAEVASVAGQLGIKVNDISDFTEVMIKLGDSTNITSEEAGSMLAKFANITKMDSKNYSKLGSTIVDLGNHFATTEQDIVNMASRLASAGTQANMSQSDILSFATALSATGLQAEMGGSAFSKFILNVQSAVESGSKDLEAYAKVAEMSADEFSKAFKDDATKAITVFLKGLGNSKKQGKSAAKVLADLDIKEVRLRDTLLRASNASDLFSNAVNRGTKAWEKNTALNREAEKRYSTTESKLKILQNSFQNLATNLFEQVQPALKGFIDKLTALVKNEGAMKALAVAVGSFVSAFAYVKLMQITKVLSDMMKRIHDIATVQAVATAATTTQTGAIVAETVATEGGTVATRLFNAAWASNPLGVVLTIIGAVATAIVGLSAVLDKNTKKQQTATEKINKYIEANNEYIASVNKTQKEQDQKIRSIKSESGEAQILTNKLEKLTSVEDKSREQKAKIKAIVERLNDLMPKLNLKYDEEADKLNKTTGAIKEQIKQREKLILQKAYEKQAEVYADQMVETEMRLAEAKEKQAKAQKKVNDLEAKGKTGGTAGSPLTGGVFINAEKQKYDQAKKNLESITQRVKDLENAHSEAKQKLNTSLINLDKIANEQEITEKFSKINETLKAQGTKIPKSVASGIKSGKYAIPQSVDEATKLIKFDKVISKAKNAGIKIPNSLTKGISNGSVGVSAGVTRINSIVKFDKAVKKAGMDGTDIQKHLSKQIATGEISVKSAVKTLNDKVDFQTAIDTSTIQGAKIPAKIGKSITENKGLLQNAVNDMDSTLSSGATSTGKNFVEGFILGIGEKIQNAINTVKDFGKKAWQEFKGSLGEASPSKITKKMGVYFVQGFAIGVKGATKTALKSVNNLAEIALKIADTSMGKGFTQISQTGINKATTQINAYVKNSKTKIKNLVDTSVSNYNEKIDKQISQIQERSKKSIDIYNEQKRQDAEALSTLTKQINANKKLSKKQKESNIADAKKETEAKAKILKKNIDHIKKSTKEEIETLRKAKTDYKKAGQANVKAYNDALANFATKAKEIVSSVMNTVNDNFTEKYEALVNKQQELSDKLSSFGELFSINDNGTLHVENIKKQTEAIKVYGENLLSLKTLVSDDLFTYVSGLGVEDGQKYMNYLLNLSDDALKEYDKAYIEKLSVSEKYGQNVYQTDVQKLQIKYNKAVNEAIKQVKTKLKNLGSQTIQGLISGMKKEKSGLSKAIKTIANDIINQFKNDLKIKSPSKLLADEVGAFIPSGIAQGIISNLAPIEKSLQTVRNVVLAGTSSTINKTATGGIYRGQSKSINQQTQVYNTYNQTINAPRQPSRLELYRQSKNLLNWTKR